MNERGYGVDWQDSHKYITYTDLAREQAGEKACKIRDNKQMCIRDSLYRASVWLERSQSWERDTR